MDGFRLDLAATLGRRDTGFDPQAPFLSAVEQDPVLANRVMIAEPWDIGAGGYQLFAIFSADLHGCPPVCAGAAAPVGMGSRI